MLEEQIFQAVTVLVPRPSPEFQFPAPSVGGTVDSTMLRDLGVCDADF